MEVTAAVLMKDDKVLLMRRAPGHSSAGGWEYPGGKIEPGETGEACIRRELKEELHIDAEIGSLIAETTRRSGEREIHLMAYRVRSYTGTITLTDHDSMEWVPIQELLCHEQLESDYEISRQMVARRSMNMTIQPMTEHNSREVLEMMRIFYASPAVSTNGSEEIFQADIAHCLSDDPYLEGYVLTEGDHIAGYAMIAKSFSTEFGKHCIWIEDLYFKPEYCQKGYGTQFLQFIGRRYPHAVLRLEVEEENCRAVHTYRKNGFGELPYMEMIR